MMSPDEFAEKLTEAYQRYQARQARDPELPARMMREMAEIRRGLDERHAAKAAQWERNAPRALRAMQEGNRRRGERMIAAFLPGQPQVW